jgi:hypothetical protein
MKTKTVARMKFGRELQKLAADRGIKSATAEFMSGHRYTKGQIWSFWIEGDPRFDDGVNEISKFRCTKSGDSESEWIEVLK